jgi:hypothetical protein
VTFSVAAELTGVKKLFMGGMVAKTTAAEVQAIEKVRTILET